MNSRSHRTVPAPGRRQPARLFTAWLVVGSLQAGGAAAVEISPDRREISPGQHPATGHLRCGSGAGTAHLVGNGDVVLTAAHVLFGRGPSSGACEFTIQLNGRQVSVPIDMAAVRAGSERPFSDPAARDWAAARLAGKVPGITPYRLGTAPAVSQTLRLVSGRTIPMRGAPIIENCLARAQRQSEGGRELLIDCSAQPGDSGAALLTADGRLGAIYVGFRSASPQQSAPFSERHYNFAVPLSGAIQAAVRGLTR